MVKMIAFDTETTGLVKPDATELHLQPFMVEIYAAHFDFDGTIIDEFETFVKPPVPVPDKTTEITGITNDMLIDAPSFIQIYDKLSNFFTGATSMFAHNCSFDRDILKYELIRHGLEYNFPWPKNHNCTVELSHSIQNKRLSLPKLYQIAKGELPIHKHRAKGDVLDMIECIRWLGREGFINENNC